MMDLLINLAATITLYALSITISVSYISTNLEKITSIFLKRVPYNNPSANAATIIPFVLIKTSDKMVLKLTEPGEHRVFAH